MSFQYTNAYVGPFCTSYAQGAPGDIQKFRFPLPVISRDHMAQGLMITEGRIQLTWSHEHQSDVTLGPGGSFGLDHSGIPLAIDAEVTMNALTQCAFLCVTAIGIEQKVHLERHHLDAGERFVAERYSLIAVAGDDPLVRVNGGDEKQGIRLIYARNGELEIDTVRPSLIGKFSFAG